MHIHHLAFQTADLDALGRFYTQVLGLQIVREQPGYSLWLASGDAVLMLEKSDPEGLLQHSGSKELLAFNVTPEERQLRVQTLEQAGIPIEAETEYTSYFRDPDGRRLAYSCHPLGPS